MQPLTTNPAFAELYTKDFFIEAEKLNAILEMGKDAVPELEKMIDQGIDHFEQIEKESWHENFFFIHALHLLSDLDAEESLPYMLKVAAQGQVFLDYWFSDSVDQDVPRLIAKLGRSQPEVCMDFLQDKTLYVQSRHLVMNALALIALVNPEKRPQIIAFFREHLRFLIENKNRLEEIYANEDDQSWFTVYDYASYILVDFQEKNFIELEDEIRECYRNGLMDEKIAGGEEDIVFETRETPVHQTIHEKYDELKEWAGKFSPFHPNADELERKRQEDLERTRLQLAEFARERSVLAEPEAIPVRTGPKIGRNDPCPCGSGKKYKKCCME